MQSRWEGWGLALPQRQRERLVQSWQKARTVAALAFAIAGAGLGATWRWEAGYYVAVFAGLSVIDSRWRLRQRSSGSPLGSVLLDITSIFVCMGLTAVPDSAYGIPYVYMLVSALLLLEPRAAVIAVGYATVWYPILVVVWPSAGGSVGAAVLVTAGVVTDLVLALGLIGLVMVMVRIGNREARRRAQWTRMQSAIARASNALLTGSGDNPIETSLQALLDATDATAVFVERNEEDPEVGLCSTLVAEVSLTPSDPEDLWNKVPWTELSGRNRLESGHSHVIRYHELVAEERRRYEVSDIRSELDIPIIVDGEWWGLVGFGSADPHWSWRTIDESLLFTAAEMIGAFLERATAQDELNRTISDLDVQVRYQHGLAECAALLQNSSDLDALQLAVEILQESAGVAYAYIEEPPSEGSEQSIIYSAGDTSAVEENFRLRAEVELARPFERRPGWELRLPIEAHGRRRCAIVFADNSEKRPWAAHEVRALQTAAQMVGAFWERIEAAEDLNRLVRSKDEFIASVSHEIRTPLTSVLGLAVELRDRRAEFGPEETQELMSIIADQSTEVADIVNDLLVAARADINTLAIHPQAIDLVQLARDVIAAGPPLGDVELTGIEIPAWADPQRTRQILRNLTTNAARYGGPNVRVTVGLVRNKVTLEVADDGPGVADGQEEIIFEPFQRAHQAPTQPASVGLGLAVARQLARVMGGDLVYQRSGGWTRFVLSLPIVAAQSPASLASVSRTEPAA